jgi:tetratricopeptide (TPR) repeat protein
MLETRLQPQASSAVGCWHLANRKARAGEVQEAEALYSKAIRLNPVMFQAYYSRGLLRRNIGKLSEAVADLESTVRISPTFRGGYVQKGLINEQMGNLENARHDFEEAAKVDPRDPEALYHLARFLEIAGEPVRAVQLYQKALGLRPKPELHKLIMDRIASLQDAVKQAASKGSAQPDNSRRLW